MSRVAYLRRIISLLLPILCFSTFSPPSTSSQIPLGPAVSPSPIQANLVGIAAAVRGTIELSREGVVGKKIESGENIYLCDKITTDDKGRMQILLLDETVFTIGPNSALVIDKFIYDPQTHDGEIKAKIVKGTFRFVTGKIGHKKPSQMTVDLPAGSIGIRGTIVAGQTEGTHSFVMLMGPGEGNNTGNTAGAMTLSNDVNGTMQVVEISRAGYGSVIEGDGTPPLPPFQVPQDQINSLMSSLTPSLGAQSGSSGGGGGGAGDGGTSGGGGTGANDAGSNAIGNIGSASAVSGENTIAALGNANDFAGITENINQLTTESSPASQNSVTESSGSPPPSHNIGGTSFYSDTVTVSGPFWSGQYSFYLSIDNDARQFSGNVKTLSAISNLGSPPPNTVEIDGDIPLTGFGSLVSNSITFSVGDIVDTDTTDSPNQMNGIGLTVTFSSNPENGFPDSASHTLTISNPSSNNITGSATTCRDGVSCS